MTARRNPRRIRIANVIDEDAAGAHETRLFLAEVLPNYRDALARIVEEMSTRWRRVMDREGYSEPSLDPRREIVYAKTMARTVRDALALIFLGRVINKGLLLGRRAETRDQGRGTAHGLDVLQGIFENYAAAYERWIVAVARWRTRPEVFAFVVERSAANAISVSDGQKTSRRVLRHLDELREAALQPDVFAYRASFGIAFDMGAPMRELLASLSMSLIEHRLARLRYVDSKDPTHVLQEYIDDPLEHTLANVEAMAAKATEWAEHGEPFDEKAASAEEARLAALDSDALIAEARAAYRAYVPPKPKRKR